MASYWKTPKNLIWYHNVEFVIFRKNKSQNHNDFLEVPQCNILYRRTPVRIIYAYHVPPDPILVTEQMKNLIAEFSSNKKLHPIEYAALFHLKFEGILPFVDGNGRTGHLILNLVLMQAGSPPINVKYSDRKQYYETFDSHYQGSNKSTFIYLISELLKEQLTIYVP